MDHRHTYTHYAEISDGHGMWNKYLEMNDLNFNADCMIEVNAR